MEVLHNDRHLDRPNTSVSRSTGTILHRLRLALSVSISLSLATTSSCTIFQLTVEDDLWQSVVAPSYHRAVCHLHVRHCTELVRVLPQ